MNSNIDQSKPEEVQDALKRPSVIERIQDKYVKADEFMKLVSMKSEVLSVSDVLGIIRKSLKAFPRVKKGMSYLISFCTPLAANDYCNETEGKSFFDKGQLPLIYAVLVLWGYDIKVIPRILGSDTKKSNEEKKLLEDCKNICSIIYGKRNKKQLYNFLRNKMNPYLAAVYTVTLFNYYPLLNVNKVQGEMSDGESLPHVKEKELLKRINDLLKENSYQAEKIKDLETRNEVLRDKIIKSERLSLKNSANIKLPASLQAVLA